MNIGILAVAMIETYCLCHDQHNAFYVVSIVRKQVSKVVCIHTGVFHRNSNQLLNGVQDHFILPNNRILNLYSVGCLHGLLSKSNNEQYYF